MEVIEVAIKSPSSGVKSPAQMRLESRAPRSPPSPEQVSKKIDSASKRHQALLSERAEKGKMQYERAKELSSSKSENINSTQQSLLESVEKRLDTAEKKRHAASEKALEKTKTMNQRVSDKQKIREAMDAAEKEKYDVSTGQRMHSAEERRLALLEETKAKAAAEVAKARELAAQKQQMTADLDKKLLEQQKAAEERRLALLTEQKDRAAAIVAHAKDVASSHQQKEAMQREELKHEIDNKLAGAENRRQSQSHSPTRLVNRSPPSAERKGGRTVPISSPVAAPAIE